MHDKPQQPPQKPQGNDNKTRDMQETLADIPAHREERRFLNRYRLIGSLGQGNMGVVHRCYDEVGDIDVAVKTLPPAISHSPQQIEQVRENFRLVERLHHPNIAALKTLERDPDSGDYYLIMECVSGVNLQEYRKQNGGRLTLDLALPILRQVALALDYGHSEKIIHRDIKPSNIMVDVAGRVKLLDFGLASQFYEALSTEFTPQNTISGTLPYMAPEQWQGKYQDSRTDQYALAAAACELLSGRPPFQGKEVSVIRELVLNQPPDKPEEISDKVWSALVKGLAKERSDRYSTCLELVQALEAAGQGVQKGNRGRKMTTLALAAVVVIGAGLAILLWSVLGRGQASGGPGAAGKAAGGSSTSSPSPATAQGVIPRYLALTIGISDYNDHGAEGWDDLLTASGDAKEVADVLERDYHFQVTRLHDGAATRDAIMVALDEIASLTENDAVLVYYAGHGLYEEKLGEGYWIPSDARRTSGSRLPKEDWIWNSTITKMIGASAAKHILVVADACYGGSLFRGGDMPAPNRQLQWYKRAINAPSRFLITSGDLEPVLDSGAKHSIFAQQVLNVLQYPDKDVFSASDLGTSVREKVSMLTGQLVRMGPMKVASDAGGEFVFIHNPSVVQDWREAPVPENAPGIAGLSVGPEAESLVKAEPVKPPVVREQLQDALVMRDQGATNSAQKLISALVQEKGDDPLVKTVARYLDQNRRSEQLSDLRALVDRLEERKKEAGTAGDEFKDYARPRIVACLGPVDRGQTADGESLTTLYRICLLAELERTGGVIAIERENLQELLSEMDLGTSDLSDKRAQLAIGQLLPASMLLLGDLVPGSNGGKLYLRLVDTETTRMLGTFQPPAGAEMNEACEDLARQITAKAVAAKPLTARVLGENNGLLQAGVGRFQGASPDQVFKLVQRTSTGGTVGGDFREEELGTARIVTLGEMTSDLKPDWTGKTPPSPGTVIWITETPPLAQHESS